MAAPQTSIPAGYETTIITRSELSDEALKTIQNRLIEVIGTFKGEVVINEDWGKRRLAYPIKKESRGHYTYLVYTGVGDVVHEIERNLRMQEHVLRFLSVNLGKDFEPAQFQKRRSDLQAAAKRREEEREARKEERNAEKRMSQGDDRGSYRRSEMEDRDDTNDMGDGE